MVERFFNSAGYADTDYRQSLLPINLEIKLFLKVNHRLWDKHTIENIKFKEYQFQLLIAWICKIQLIDFHFDNCF